MIDNTDLNDLLMKAINTTKSKVLNFEFERVAFERFVSGRFCLMHLFTFDESLNEYVLSEHAIKTYLSGSISSQLKNQLHFLNLTWECWLSRAEIALGTEVNILAGLSENTLVPNKRITFFFQDDDEPENAVDSINETIDQQSKNILGENYEFKDIVLINRIKQAYLGTDKIYATWDSPKKEKFIFASHEECLNIINGKEV